MNTQPTSDDRPAILRGSCACGACSFEVNVHPTERFICHCLFCQAFVGRSYTDVTIVRASDVVTHNNENVTYRNPERLPPGFAQGRGSRFGDPDRARFVKCASLDRGTCDTCGQPFIETIGPGRLGAVFIPSANFHEQDDLPPVQRHIFDRLHEGEGPHDQLPRHDGFVASQVAIVGMILRTFVALRPTNA